MSLSVYLLVAVPALVAVVVLWLAVRWWTRREPPADDRLSLWDEIVEVPAWSTLPEPDPDGWSSQVGWSAWAQWLQARWDAWCDVEPVLFDALHNEWAPRLAIDTRRPLEIEAS